MAKSRANRASPPRPYEVLFQMVIGKWISQALGTIVEIGVPDQLAKGARRCSDIAREAGVSEDGIYSLLHKQGRAKTECDAGYPESMSSIKRDVKKKLRPQSEARFFLEIQPTVILLR